MPTRSTLASLDIVFAGDMAGSVEHCLRIAGEAILAHASGYRVGMIHVPSAPDETVPISPEIRAAMHGTNIEVVDPERQTAAKLLVLHPPLGGSAMDRCMALVKARRVVIVPGEIEELEKAPDDLLSMPQVSVAPATPAMRDTLRKHSKFRLEPQNWLPVLEATSHSATSEPLTSPRIGFIIPADWPKTVDAIADMVKGESAIDIHVWRDRGPRRQRPQTPGNWKVLDGVETSLAWFLRRIDVLVVMQGPERPQLPVAIVAAAQSAGKLVLAPPSRSDEPPPGVSMVDPRRIVATARHLLGNRPKRPGPEARSEREANRLRRRFGKLVGAARPAHHKRRTAGRQKPRVLFLPKGGVGVGHVARLLAIARRAGNGFEPVIVSLSETVGLIETLGFTAEYIPSAAYAGVRPADWNPWFQYELEQLIDAYEARAVVFDGSDPPATLSRAVASRNWCRGVWVRRGMWAQGFDPSLQRSGDYDLIIEPGELAAARDRGATASRRHEAIQVEPITLLDRRELLSRAVAAAAVGLDPERPAALVQLGSGENRDILGLLDKIVTECRRYPELQLAIVQWANSTAALNLWPGVKILNGAPLSLYYRAFDFSISAAGYNSFHELIGFGLPSLFVPNGAPDMDDQAARSAFAQDNGAAIELRDHEFDEFPGILDLFMKPTFRSVMEASCNQLTRRNGADAASRAIAELVA